MNQSTLKPVIFIMGPTASGKTDLAIQLCQRYAMEIISVDSALIYKEMDIGTAKPTANEINKAPHHLIDFLDPSSSYSVAQFRLDALKKIRLLHQQNKMPLLVGGTMLYHRALLYGLSELPASNPELRHQLQEQIKKEGLSALYLQLRQCDPQSAEKIHPNDPQRILRALEVFRITGKPLSVLQQETKQPVFSYPYKKIVISPGNREILRERIKKRFLNMLEQGFVEEVTRLYQRGDLNSDLPSMRSVGYRQVWEYLEGRVDYETMIENAINVTRQFAKRQMTWLRKETDALCLDPDDAGNLAKVEGFIKDELSMIE